MFALALILSAVAGPAAAQTAEKAPPPIWDVQLGASFVGTSGNSDTTTGGGDFELHRRWTLWQLESNATGVRTTTNDVKTAERYLGTIRGQRTLTSILGLSVGERAERDRFAGMDFRSITDAGLSWALVAHAAWTLDGLSSLAWNHEHPTLGVSRDDPVGLLQVLSKIKFGAGADTTERITVYPDFSDRSAYRAEGEVTAQAAMNARFALKVGCLWRFSNAPVPGFLRSDTTTTASIVVRWKAATLVGAQ